MLLLVFVSMWLLNHFETVLFDEGFHATVLGREEPGRPGDMESGLSRVGDEEVIAPNDNESERFFFAQFLAVQKVLYFQSDSSYFHPGPPILF
jgi:hypothetical protein